VRTLGRAVAIYQEAVAASFFSAWGGDNPPDTVDSWIWGRDRKEQGTNSGRLTEKRGRCGKGQRGKIKKGRVG